MSCLRRCLRVCSALVLLGLLAGCMVGPKYQKPPVPVTPAFKEPPPDSYKESETDEWKRSHPNSEALRGNWWEIFGDPKLNALEEQVTVSNQDLKIAEARFRQARTMVRYNRSAEFPTIGVAPNIQSLRYSPNEPYFPSTVGTNARGLFTLPFDLSYEVDLWGRIRRTVTAAGEEAQASAADLETAALSLHAELAVDYFELCSADAQQRLLDATVEQYADNVKLTTALLDGGAAPVSDVIQAKTQLDTTRVQDSDIGVMRAQYEHAIAILIGKPPAEFALAPSPLNLEPPVIPVGIPSQLLERRPDIAASERRVGEANEGIGIARAAYFPSLVLSAVGGLEGTAINNLFSWASRFWAVGPTMAETIFDGGRRRATSEGALANYDATVANYRQTTLVAFQEVEDNLAALRILEHEAGQQREATAEALRGVEIFTNRYQGGVDPYLEVITADTIALANERNEIDILRRRMDASVLLIKGLGGGWDVSKLPQVSSMR
jgi:NodT family efflux transporter outer membrane factor (OMF) lipoprotein